MFVYNNYVVKILVSVVKILALKNHYNKTKLTWTEIKKVLLKFVINNIDRFTYTFSHTYIHRAKYDK